mmetsp:Transcript_56079/g.160993  ORF Transcript_56079/g.160993 Transcript_56079/m.160993 type:complete len:454 (+) Transcript_56079:102-1463(+)
MALPEKLGAQIKAVLRIRPASKKVTAAQRLVWRTKFQEYDTSGDGKLDRSELRALLLKGNAEISEAEVSTLFRQVDKNNNGTIDFDEFVDYLCDMSLPFEPAPAEVQAKFKEHFGAELDRVGFLRLCSECKLFSKFFQSSDAEGMFDKARPRGKHTIGYEALDKLLSKTAGHLKVPPSEVHEQVLKARMFKSDASLAGSTRRGLMPAEGPSPAVSRQSSKSPCRSDDEEADGPWDEVEMAYTNFCKDRKPPMSGPEFARVCDEALFLMDNKIKRAECDIVFSTFMSKQTKQLDFNGFKRALRSISQKKDTPVRVLQQKISLLKQGPKLVGTEFHDVAHLTDKAHYRRKSVNAEYDIGEEDSWHWVKGSYDALDAGGGLDSVAFRRMCEDVGLLDKSFPQADADIVFASHTRQKRMASFEDFQNMLREVARRKQQPVEDVQKVIGYSSGPRQMP